MTGSLHASNEQALKWYTSILQCLFQYHPDNLVKAWPAIERIVNLLLLEWENQSYLEIALDIVYNALLCLCKPHLAADQFVKWTNANYTTLTLDWQHITPEAKALVDAIYQKYFVAVEKYLRTVYGEDLKADAS